MFLTIEGRDLSALDHESGGHRIQRVPLGERRGRVHSSTVTVYVRHERETTDHPALRRAEGDFTVEWYSGSGAGGQHRNKHQNSARLRHIPTGLVVTSQCRSREESLRKAHEAMAERLDGLVDGDLGAEEGSARRQAIGSGMRADKRRTWRFQDDQVVDHVTGRSARCTDLMRGKFSSLWT